MMKKVILSLYHFSAWIHGKDKADILIFDLYLTPVLDWKMAVTPHWCNISFRAITDPSASLSLFVMLLFFLSSSFFNLFLSKLCSWFQSQALKWNNGRMSDTSTCLLPDEMRSIYKANRDKKWKMKHWSYPVGLLYEISAEAVRLKWPHLLCWCHDMQSFILLFSRSVILRNSPVAQGHDNLRGRHADAGYCKSSDSLLCWSTGDLIACMIRLNFYTADIYLCLF